MSRVVMMIENVFGLSRSTKHACDRCNNNDTVAYQR
jgi:hypothetical protein